VVVEFTHRGYVKRSAVNNSRSQKKQKADNGLPENDFVIQAETAKTDQNVVVITSAGKAYPLKVEDIPSSNGRAAKGKPLVSLLPNGATSGTETIVKRLLAEELVSLTNRGLTTIKFKDDDQLVSVQLIQPGQNLVLASAGGRLLRFQANDEQLPIMGRTAMGLQALRLRKQEQLVGCVALNKLDELLLVTRSGYAKRLPVNLLRKAHRGDLPTQVLSFTSKSDALAGMVIATAESEVALVTNNQQVVRIAFDAVDLWGKEGIGDRLTEIKDNENIVTVSLLAPISASG
jgi:DNA gyrase subunit A